MLKKIDLQEVEKTVIVKETKIEEAVVVEETKTTEDNMQDNLIYNMLLAMPDEMKVSIE